MRWTSISGEIVEPLFNKSRGQCCTLLWGWLIWEAGFDQRYIMIYAKVLRVCWRLGGSAEGTSPAVFRDCQPWVSAVLRVDTRRQTLVRPDQAGGASRSPNVTQTSRVT